MKTYMVRMHRDGYRPLTSDAFFIAQRRGTSRVGTRGRLQQRRAPSPSLHFFMTFTGSINFIPLLESHNNSCVRFFHREQDAPSPLFPTPQRRNEFGGAHLSFSPPSPSLPFPFSPSFSLQQLWVAWADTKVEELCSPRTFLNFRT